MKFRGDVIGAKLEYPLLRSRRADVRTGLELEHQILGSEAAGVNISDRRVSRRAFSCRATSPTPSGAADGRTPCSRCRGPVRTCRETPMTNPATAQAPE